MVALNISMWMGRKKSKEAENIVLTHFSAKNAGNFYKKLVDDPSLKDIYRIANAARIAHSNMTQPWDDQGYRYLSPVKVLDYIAEMNTYSDEYYNAVNVFLNKYNDCIDEAKNRLGALFNVKDYPSIEHIKNKFSFSFHTQSIPIQINNDLLDDTIAASLQEKLSKEINDRFNKVKKSIWHNAYEKLSLIRERLSSDNIFRNSTIENIVEYANDIIPLTDIVDDTLADFLDELKSVYSTVDIDRLRTDNEYRKKYATTTSRLMYEASQNG
jgi:hypothetical protein